MRKIAAMLVALGLTLGLLGAGIGATFTDSNTATANISVGTFALNISAVAPTGGTAVVAADNKSVTITCPLIVSSAAGSCVSAITVTNAGSIPADVSMAITTAPLAPFTSHTGPVASTHLLTGNTLVVNGGLDWPSLDSTVLGHTYSVTYTFSASA